MRIRIQDGAFDPAAELNDFPNALVGVGAVVTFSGVVRDDSGDLHHMEIEHYPGMTERAIAKIAETARTRWGLNDVLVVHRYGKLAPEEVIMMVATAAGHRKAAFEAAEYLMDYLKSRAPFWKKEVTASGERWVEATRDDEAALGRW